MSIGKQEAHKKFEMVSFAEWIHKHRQINIGAMQLSVESVVAIFLFPWLLCIAAFNEICLIVVSFVIPLLLVAANHLSTVYLSRTRFFFSWGLCSIVTTCIVFELVPLLELLPEENLIFRICLFGSLYCFYRV